MQLEGIDYRPSHSTAGIASIQGLQLQPADAFCHRDPGQRLMKPSEVQVQGHPIEILITRI